ncbi:MAG: fumarylacetoacetate hydrolase family protein [Chloroflexi bacterium]|nr:fumarylacetoacetate hydrolase family protein [Chloroflexota bacterium]
MKLVSFLHDTRTLVGELVGEHVYNTSIPGSMFDTIRRGITPTRTSEHYPLADVQLIAPLRPGKIIAIGRNYVEHAQELSHDVPSAPIIFAKFPSSVIGHGETIAWRSSITQKVDWEGELAVVIGKKARDVSEADAYKHVFGYTIANDVSARDLQLEIDAQWTRGKSLDTFCPMGPYIITPDEVPDPHTLTVKTLVNDEVVQDGKTELMIFKIPHLIAYCSRMFTLEPGDVILTGTPSGVGHGRKPPMYLKDGDTVTVSISSIGELRNPCKTLD